MARSADGMARRSRFHARHSDDRDRATADEESPDPPIPRVETASASLDPVAASARDAGGELRVDVLDDVPFGARTRRNGRPTNFTVESRDFDPALLNGASAVVATGS